MVRVPSDSVSFSGRRKSLGDEFFSSGGSKVVGKGKKEKRKRNAAA